MYTERNRLSCRYCSYHAESHEDTTTKRNDRKLADFVNIIQLSLQRKNANSATEIEKTEKEKALKARIISIQGLFLIFSIFILFTLYSLFVNCRYFLESLIKNHVLYPKDRLIFCNPLLTLITILSYLCYSVRNPKPVSCN